MSIIDDAITEAIEQGRPFTIEDVRAIIADRADGEAFLEQLLPNTLPSQMGRLRHDPRVEAAGRVQVDNKRTLRVWAPSEDEVIDTAAFRNVPVLELAYYCWRNTVAVAMSGDELRAVA